jgi:hypothetical protein
VDEGGKEFVVRDIGGTTAFTEDGLERLSLACGLL